MMTRIDPSRIVAAEVGSPMALSILYDGRPGEGSVEVRLLQPPIRIEGADGHEFFGLTVNAVGADLLKAVTASVDFAVNHITNQHKEVVHE